MMAATWHRLGCASALGSWLLAAPVWAQSLQCALAPTPAVLGHPLAWTITARDAVQPLPAFTAAQFAPDWLLQGQQGASGSDARGHREQTLRLELVPLRAGALHLPEVRLGARLCPAQTVQAAAAPPGEAPLQWRTRLDPAQPLRLQPVRIELQVAGGGNLVWEPPQAHSAQALLEPLPGDTRRETLDGTPQLVQVFAWRALPLQAGEMTVDFGLVRAHAFGALRVYAPPKLAFTVAPLPQWWPAWGLVGRPEVQIVQAPQRLVLGQTGVWRLRLRAAGLDRAQLQQLVQRWRERLQAHVPIAAVELRRGEPADTVAPVWDVALFFQPRHGSLLQPPRLRLDYLDPQQLLPAALWLRLPAVEVDDPRPKRIAIATGSALALLALLAALRALVLCLQRRRRLAHGLAALQAATSADALRRAWLALPVGAPQPTLAAWTAAHAPDDPALHAAALALQAQLYGSGKAPSARVDPVPLAQALRARFTRCGRLRRLLPHRASEAGRG
ncbi:MAG: hypothetical protein ACP5F9_03240 [Thiomonas sp.]